MTDRSFAHEIDPNPLVEGLLAKTRDGRLHWEPTADENTFIASVGGNTTLKLTVEYEDSYDQYGQPEQIRVPFLYLIDSNGRKVWEIRSSEVKGSLDPLRRLVLRVANKIDERMDGLLEAIEKL